MQNRHVKHALYIVAGLLIMLGLHFYESENRGDSSIKAISLAKTEKMEWVVDLAKMGPLKYYLEPNVMSLYLRIQDTPKNKTLTYQMENLDGVVTQASKKSIWRPIMPGDTLKSRGRGYNPLFLELHFPREKVSQYAVQQGTIRILADRQQAAEITVRIINSKYKS